MVIGEDFILLSGTSGIGNGLFGKLVVDDVPASSSKKKKNKGKKRTGSAIHLP
jgi:hypothetical protein